MKKCTKCGLVKKLEEFPPNKRRSDGRHSACRECKRIADMEQYYKNPLRRQQIIASNKIAINRNIRFVNRYVHFQTCKTCGEEDFRIFVFHHKDPTTKVNSISRLKTSACSLAKLKEEIRKCDILCANCHRIKHYAY